MSAAPTVAAQAVRTGTPEALATVGPEQMPNGFLLESAYPNPFSASATVGFAVTRAQRVEVGLYDALGRKVRSVFNGAVQSGVRYEARLESSGLPSGLYLVRLVGDTFSTTRRVTVLH
jgi:hypothetical protein